MNKSDRAKTIIISVLLSFVAYLVFGRFVAAKISTWPLLNHWKILSPQAPIVINNTQQVRVSNTTDVLDTANTAKYKLSAIVIVDSKNSELSLVGEAVNLTTDGVFLAPETAFSQTGATYAVVLADGRTAPIVSTVLDPAAGLVFAKAQMDNVPVAPLDSSATLNVGEKVVLLANSTVPYTTRLASSFVSNSQADIEQKTFDADHPSRGFAVQGVSQQLVPGQTVVDSSGNVVGMWNGTVVVSSDVLKTAMNLYFANSGKIVRPSFGFSYSILTKADAVLLKISQGAQVTAVAHGAKNGLEVGDIITSVDGQTVDQNNTLEPLLEKYKPGDTMNLQVLRNGNQLNIQLPVGTLK